MKSTYQQDYTSVSMYPPIPPSSLSTQGPPDVRSQESSDRSFAMKLQGEGTSGVPGTSTTRGDAALAASLQHEDDRRQAEQTAGGAYLWAETGPNPEEGRPPILDDEDRSVRLGHLLRSAPSTNILPRVNSLMPPMIDVVTDDRKRLLTHLDTYGLEERTVKGDGACQFRSLSDQLFGSPEHYANVRGTVVGQLRQYPDRYQPYVPDDYTKYCLEMSQHATWGDHVTLQAAADAYNRQIMVVTSYKESCCIKIEPSEANTHKVDSSMILYISFWAEVHYNSLYPKGMSPPAPGHLGTTHESISSASSSDGSGAGRPRTVGKILL
eukprot:gene22920-30099_t